MIYGVMFMARKHEGPTWFKVFGFIGPAVLAVDDCDAGAALKAALRLFTGESGPAVEDMTPAARAVFGMLRQGVEEAQTDYARAVTDGKRGSDARWKKST